MKFEFKLNGTTQLTIQPETNLEREFFNELFSGNVTISPKTTSSNRGEVIIEKASAVKKTGGDLLEA